MHKIFDLTGMQSVHISSLNFAYLEAESQNFCKYTFVPLEVFFPAAQRSSQSDIRIKSNNQNSEDMSNPYLLENFPNPTLNEFSSNLDSYKD